MRTSSALNETIAAVRAEVERQGHGLLVKKGRRYGEIELSRKFRHITMGFIATRRSGEPLEVFATRAATRAQVHIDALVRRYEVALGRGE